MAFPSRGLALSVAIHGVILLGLVVVWPLHEEEEASPVPAPVAVSLAAVGGAPASTPTAVREEVAATDAIEPLAETEPEEVKAVDMAAEPVKPPAPMEAIPAVPAENATVAAIPDAVPIVEPPPPTAAPETVPEAAPEKEPETTTAKEPEPPAKAATPAQEAEPSPTEETAESAEPSINASNAAAAAATGSAATKASVSAGMTNYAAVLQAWLQDHMRYPRRAKLRNMQGTATLWLSIDAEGHVLDFRIKESSGHNILDSEVEDLVRRAEPMPPVPETMKDSSIEFVVPVQFVLR
jgi:periplasmic protein TonB